MVLYFPVFGCKRLFQAVLDEEDISNGIGEQRGTWRKNLPFYKSLTVDPDWLAHKKKYLEMGIGERLTPAQRHQMSNFGEYNLQKCPGCHTMMARDVAQRQPLTRLSQRKRDTETSCGTVCGICSTHFCWNCAVPRSGKFGWRTDSSAHEPTCVEYRPCAPGAQPLYVQRRLEEERFAEESKLQFPQKWPSQQHE